MSAKNCAGLRQMLSNDTPFLTLENFMVPDALDPCRLTVCTAGTQLTGHTLADTLFGEFSVACEMSDERNVVFILTGSDSAVSILRLRQALVKMGKRAEQGPPPRKSAEIAIPARKMRVREALFSPRETVSLDHAEGRVCARPVTPYPPGVPLLYPGEEIGAAQIEMLRQRCYNTVEAVRETP